MEIVKSMNTQGGKRFYVAYRGDEWIAKIFYVKKSNEYKITFETPIPNKKERDEICKFTEKLNKELKAN